MDGGKPKIKKDGRFIKDPRGGLGHIDGHKDILPSGQS